MDIAELTPVERRICRAFSRGAAFDVRRDGDGDTAHAEGGEGTVRAEVLRALILSGSSEPGETPALHVTGARITGVLDLRHAEVRHPIRLTACNFQHALELDGARTRLLDLNGSYLPALAATAIRVDGALRLTDCRISGSVRLSNAEISGGIFLDRSHVGTDGGWALHLDHVSVGTDVWAPGLVARGGIRLGAANVAGAVNLEDAQVKNPGGDALDAARLNVGTVLNAGGLTTEGRVRLTGSKVAGWFSFIEARLSNPGGVALGISSCQATQLTLRDAHPINGDVKMHYASFKVIEAEPRVWPARVRLDGLTYETLTPRLPAADRLALLQRDADGFVPHSYEQLAASYRRGGDDADTRTVQLAEQRRRRATLPWYAKLWGHVQDATVGYGFRPTRAGSWLLALLILGSITYGLHHPAPVEQGKGPAFNPPVYVLDLLLPVIDFGQRNAFAPAGPYQWLSYVLIASGWVLTTAVATAITRALNRQ
ncbi:membrane-associated oxidoreductase [Streptomyces sp. NPDC004069]|uniref:membrane-associated oxidoreductase n=1 Tax=Streptomyces sp. NPDC052043 TaxID=3365684 RepID=UPI0037CED993